MAGRTVRMWMLAMAVVSALLIVGCSGAERFDSAHRGSVDTRTQQEVVAALAQRGITASEPSQVRMTWIQGQGDAVLVDGRFTLGPTTNRRSFAAVYEVRRLPDRTWSVQRLK